MLCPACESEGLRPFYDVRGIPTQSNLLVETRDAAASYSRGDLTLAVCSTCGFITNTSFDPASQELSGKYEATQGHSPTFSAFARKLAQRWTDRYKLAGKRILEIGCGQGEFVLSLCETAGANGIGIDPILSPDRQPAGRVRFISGYYSEKYRDLPADFICCRHTLEHIHDPLAFLRNIRRAIGDRTDIVVAFEVPDTLRVLRECAFWDLYFEHCSYFVPETLRTVFELAGFEVLDLYREFDDQYLVIDVKPAPASKPTPQAWDFEQEIARFQSCGATYRRLWLEQFDGWSADQRRVALWGSGSKAVGFLSTLGVTDTLVPLVVDINPNKQGTYLPGTGQKIVAPNAMIDYQPDVVIVMNPIYVREIGASLEAMNLRPRLFPLTGFNSCC